MSSRFFRSLARLAALFAVLALLIVPVSSLAAGPAVVEIATGLNNPRHMAFGPEGALYVAEAGVGGPEDGVCRTGAEGGNECYGPTGSITRIDLRRGTQEQVATGLPSFGAFGATGPTDISFWGRGNGFIVTGLGANPANRATYGAAGMKFGRLVRMVASGKYTYRADVAGFEATHNPDGGAVDSNPYGVLALSDGSQVVADAGGNSLLKVDEYGNISLLAVFPDRLVDAPPFLPLPPGSKIPMQSVPTSVALGPDGYFYVGELTGFPFPVGGANIYKVPMGGGTPEVAFSGFSAVVDIAFGPDGSLYVAQMFDNFLAADPANPSTLFGSIIEIAPDGARTTVASLLAPGGVEVGRDGAVYVTTGSILPGGGSVVRITQ